jgi:hypothetical protein
MVHAFLTSALEEGREISDTNNELLIATVK